MSRIPDTHAEAWDLIPWLANGRLAAGDREWVEAHVAGCAECRAELAAQRTVVASMSADDAAGGSGHDEQKSFNKLWARIEAAESATSPQTLGVTSGAAQGAAGNGAGGSRTSRTVRWLAAAVVVQAIGLGVLGFSAARGDSMRANAARPGEFVTVADAQPRLDAPAVRLVFAPQASIETINTLLTHQGLSLVSGPGAQGNYTAILSPDAVASGASAETVAQVISKDPNVSFAQPVAR
ncbi:MAG TPA: zf-HC2 domain-containing protein [Steroidobacteraceae bacterium]|nr:zf-HC2 domain-containing protein [Steroidobacteraceae bacterium]